ncbi:MAG: nuclear transport factor 2 family protein [Hyphomonadaceae bacterium]|nr:nuclear transport factor 2 family protein [Hyphomonadaceae bacterium]
MSGSIAEARSDRTEATRAVAQSFLHQAFVRNEFRAAYVAHAAPDFIQHNPRIGDGLEAHRAYFDAMARNEPNGDNSRWAHVFDMVLVDDDLFAVFHHTYRDAEDPGKAVIDIWRVADGRIVEHWDVIQTIPKTSLHRNGIACGIGESYEAARALGDTLARPTCGRPDPNASREETLRVIADYVAEVGRGDVRTAIERWFSADYKQHSPTIPDGAQGAIAYLEREFGRGRDLMPTAGPARVVAEGDLVLFHRLVTYPGASGPSANMDIFRVTNGRISEHWDLKQPVPKTSANTNGMW